MIALNSDSSRSFPAMGISPLQSLDLNLSAYNFLPHQQGSQGFPGPAQSSVASAGSVPQIFQAHESMPLPQNAQQRLPQAFGGPQDYYYSMAQNTPPETYSHPAYNPPQPGCDWEQTGALPEVNAQGSSGPFQATMQPNSGAGMLPPLDSPMANGNPGMPLSRPTAWSHWLSYKYALKACLFNEARLTSSQILRLCLENNNPGARITKYERPCSLNVVAFAKWTKSLQTRLMAKPGTAKTDLRATHMVTRRRLITAWTMQRTPDLLPPLPIRYSPSTRLPAGLLLCAKRCSKARHILLHELRGLGNFDNGTSQPLGILEVTVKS